MVKKTKIFFVLLLLIFVSLSAVSAADDAGDIVLSDDETTTDFLEISDNDVATSENSQDVVSASYTVNSDSYSQYFDSNGKMLSSVNSGDTLTIDGSISDKNFIINKNVTIYGSQSSDLKNCKFEISKTASGTSIFDLKITNVGNDKYGIFINGATNCLLKGCTITTTGVSSYAIALCNSANYNNVTDNFLKTYGITYGHGTRSTPPLVLTGSHHNYIANNYITCDDANGIYLSSYAGGPSNGGESHYNLIYNNTVEYNKNILPTSWSYAIQIMGSNNVIDSNTVIRAYRGISAGVNNQIINNRIINITGADYNNPGVPVGGDAGITVGVNSIVKNNSIINASIFGSGFGIYAADNSIIEDNYVQLIKNGVGISAGGSNVIVKNNVIFTNTGAGVYYRGEGSNLRVERNNITSISGLGVLIEKISKSRLPNNVTVIYNIINNTGDYAIDASQANKEGYMIDNSNVAINKNAINTPQGVFDPSRPDYKFNGTTIIITPENYDQYIDNESHLKNINERDILKFSGIFNNKIIVVNMGIKIIGEDAVFYNSTFKVISGNVWIENIKIINKNTNRLNAWGILVNEVEGAKIINNEIEVNDKNAAYAIYILKSNYIDVIDNKLTSSGNYLTYTLLAHTIEECNITGNTIFANGTGQVYGFEQEHCLDGGEVCIDGNHSVQEVYRTYGILMLYSSYNFVSNNVVNATSALNEIYATYGGNSSTNAVVGIDLYYNSHNNVFYNNDVTVEANDNYLYGMGVLGAMTGHSAAIGQGASNNIFDKNIITVKGTYYGTGFIAGESSENTVITNNVMEVTATNVTYGIILEMSQISDIENNKITLNSDVAYGIQETSSSNNTIKNNDFAAYGKQVYGLLLSNSVGDKIIENNITAKGNGEELTFKNLDELGNGNAGIYLMASSSNNEITDNKIISQTGYAILLSDVAVGNIIKDNYLESEKGNSTSGISNAENATVSGNYINYIKGTLEDSRLVYLENGTMQFITTDADLEGANVIFYVMDGLSYMTLGNAVVKDGKATITYGIDDDFTPALYPIKATVSKQDYKTTSFDANLEIVDGNLVIVHVHDVVIVDGLKARYSALVTNVLGNPISGATVIFSYKSTDRMIGSAKTDKNGLATGIFSITGLDVGEYDLLASASDVYNYNDVKGINIGKLSILDVAPVTIKLNSNLGFGGILATLTDNNGFAVANKDVVVSIAGKNVNTKTNSLGQVILPSVNPGSYNIVLTSNNDGTYAYASASGNINVAAPITGNTGATVYYGNTVTYKVRITGSDGNYVDAGQTVTIKVGKTTYNVGTDANGYATKAIKQSAGSYTVTATYNGYTVSNKITFKPTLTAKNIAKKKGKTIKFSAKLVNKNGKILKSKKVTFKIKGKTYKVKTNKKGVATVTIKLKLKVGKYTIKSSYGGCTISNKITIKK